VHPLRPAEPRYVAFLLKNSRKTAAASRAPRQEIASSFAVSGRGSAAFPLLRRMKFINPLVVCALTMSGCLIGQESVQPLPDPQLMKQRALARMKQEEKDLERYSCTVDEIEDDLNADLSVKRTQTRRYERFFVNGQQIDHLLEKDGKELAGNEAKKEQQRTDKEVRKYSDKKNVEKIQDENAKQLNTFMRALRYKNGRRETRETGPVIVYDMAGDPAFKATNVEERFAKALIGTIWLDEKTGNPAEVYFKTSQDVKFAGGLVFSLHKGFHLHLEMQRVAEGDWIMKAVDLQGDGTAMLFMHPRFRDRQTVSKCRIYSVESQSVVSPP